MKKIISIILILIIAFCGFKIVDKLYKYNADKVQYEAIKKFKPEVKEVNDNKESDKIKEIKGINSDYKFWLNVDNTLIDYPVVQTKDNEYYLHHDFKKQNSISGTLFVDYRNDLNDKNLIIYGHNMKNKTMFQTLSNFLKREFFDSNNKIHIIQDGKEKTYEVFSVYVTTEAENYLTPKFNTDEEFQKYIETVKGTSMYKKDVQIAKDDNILTLATCSDAVGDSRILVHAKLVK